MDTSKLCRGCMKEVASWEKENFNQRTVEMFCFCTNITITEEDALPKQFCYNCIIKIESAYTFITEALKVTVTLKNILSRTNTVIVQPETKAIENRLTLPDYKISSTIENYEETIYNTTDYAPCIDNQEYEKMEEVQELQIEEVIEKEVKIDKKEPKPVEEKKNICPVCRKGFVSKAWFNKHMEKEHAGNKYACVQCSKTFSKPSQLSYHAVSHSEERKFSCPTCGKRFKRRKQLATHVRTHSDARPYACDKCSMRFKLKSVLKCHMKVHDSEKPYLCSYCGWSFSQAGNLEVHVRTHTGEKPYACSTCGFRAAAASSARRHARAHLAAPHHVCHLCRKAFYDASGLARHTRTHTGERPYLCGRCPRAFADSWKRKAHLMRAHTLALHDIPPLHRDGRPKRDVQPTTGTGPNMRF
ncbi:zinc finger protein 771 [Manduca sexta]|uniref:zinc finger protein 771 n=1 Tax=Manduca sexta TaxID=7130 RepID=UPI00189064A0|nr:zinc finger protein 771 [Manduca sexta]